MSTRSDDLRRLFGDYRLEWREGDLGALFVEPPYFGQLLDLRPTFLVGGRGTGKTTALRSLQAENAAPSISKTALGLYIRINKNSVRAFQNAGRSIDVWARVFAHYFNLVAVAEFLRVCRKRLNRDGTLIISDLDTGRLGTQLGLGDVYGVDALVGAIQAAVTQLELYVNNSAVMTPPILSAAEAPLRLVAQLAKAQGLTLYCCIDEYENLLDYQQGVLNTYIKHSEAPLTYKIGVRRFGLRNRETSGSGDLLVEPDDYCVVDPAAEPFDAFARSVADRRLQEAARYELLLPSLDRVWPILSRREEALELGGGRIAQEVLQMLTSHPEQLAWADRQAPGDLYFAKFWSEASAISIQDTVTEAMIDPDGWLNRLNNYGYASLFWLSRGRKGAKIRKYYCGIATFLQLAGGNIRYFLELLDVSLQLQLLQADTGRADIAVSPAAQTNAAREVGKRRLEQLEGLTEVGMDLKRLVLALGKVLFELARAPEGRTPEVTQFVVAGNQEARAEIERLLVEGVSHQALERTPRTKATSDDEMRDDEYRLHPIFCPYFEFSHRRKRRITLAAEDLLLVRTDPRQAIRRMLKGRVGSEPDEWPEQLSLFSSFYGANDPKVEP